MQFPEEVKKNRFITQDDERRGMDIYYKRSPGWPR